MRWRRAWWVVAVVGLAAASLQAPIASAATGDESSDNSGSGQTCVAALTPIPEGSTVEASELADFRCFDSFSAGMEFATSGRVRLDPDARSVSDAELEAAGAVSTKAKPRANPLLGIEYQHKKFGGDDLVLTGSGGSGCYAGTTYGFPSMSKLHFDNKISSAKAYSNCIGRHFAGANYYDSKYDCGGRCKSVGTLNDRTSSIKFF